MSLLLCKKYWNICILKYVYNTHFSMSMNLKFLFFFLRDKMGTRVAVCLFTSQIPAGVRNGPGPEPRVLRGHGNLVPWAITNFPQGPLRWDAGVRSTGCVGCGHLNFRAKCHSFPWPLFKNMDVNTVVRLFYFPWTFCGACMAFFFF